MAIYTIASLIHFSHNAEYIAFYPNMPQWITRETVYQVWLAIASLGVAGLFLAKRGWSLLAAIVISVYGALGLDGLGHYTLALCSEHTLAANLTIWFEVVSGFALMLYSTVLAFRMLARSRNS
jgi:hypothetical protein